MYVGDLDACKAAFDQGADLFLALDHGRLPLEAAVWGDHIAICRWMLEMGVDVRAKNAVLKRTVLHLVNSVEVCQLLLDHGADVNAQDGNGWTPLHCAAHHGGVAICKQLLNHGADVGLVSERGITVLHAAVAWGALNGLDAATMGLCKFFLGQGLSSSFIPKNPEPGYLTPFQHVVKNGYDDLVELFCEECGEDPAQRTVSGRTMQQLAGRHQITKDLLRQLRITHAVDSGIAQGYGSINQVEPTRPRGMSPL